MLNISFLIFIDLQLCFKTAYKSNFSVLRYIQTVDNNLITPHKIYCLIFVIITGYPTVVSHHLFIVYKAYSWLGRDTSCCAFVKIYKTPFPTPRNIGFTDRQNISSSPAEIVLFCDCSVWLDTIDNNYKFYSRLSSK